MTFFTDLYESDPVSNRVHPAEPQARDRVPAGGGPALAAQDQDEDQHHP